MLGTLARRLCAPGGALFGGAALASFVSAAERVSGREVVSAHAHFIRPAAPPGSLFLELEPRAAGRHRTLLAVTARQDDAVTATALVATADPEPSEPRVVWGAPPLVPPPERCPERSYADPDPRSINGALDVRVARGGRAAPDGPSSDGGCALWARLRESAAPGAALLALVADHVPFAARLALGREAGVVSLDSTLRVFASAGDEPFEWVLLEIVVAAVEGALGYGRVTLWSERGSRLGEGSQTFRVM
jgi:acyl-CoA thioesterase